MQKTTLGLVLSLVLAFTTYTQAIGQNNDNVPRSYQVTLIEARLQSEINISELSARELFVTATAPSKVDWKEVITCAALEGHQTKVMFGRNVSLVTGITESSRGKQQSISDRSIGTGLLITIAQTGNKLATEIEYQSSRLSSENDGELPPPEIETNEVTSQVVLTLGQPKVLSSSPNSILIISVDADE